MSAIWIDLDNSPHVPLFVPIIRHYRERGIDVILTARDHSQTIALLDLHGLSDAYTVVGKHSGAGKIGKIIGTLRRAKELVAEIKKRKEKIAVAVSHGSRAMVLAARWLRIPVLTMYDYEFTETAIFNRFSTKVLVPDRIPDDVLEEIGLAEKKRIKYPGLKEELYISYFSPSPGYRETFLRANGHTENKHKTLAVVRPPAVTANYHSEKSETLFDDLLQFLLSDPHTITAIIPRTADQGEDVRRKIARHPDGETRAFVLKDAVDGLELVSAADLVISGGGTMNREAALLGVPVYSIFAGRQGALDRQMEAEGAITFIRDLRDISKIRAEKRTVDRPTPLTGRTETFVIAQIDGFLIGR